MHVGGFAIVSFVLLDFCRLSTPNTDGNSNATLTENSDAHTFKLAVQDQNYGHGPLELVAELLRISGYKDHFSKDKSSTSEFNSSNL